jgi:hypothetical protein
VISAAFLLKASAAIMLIAGVVYVHLCLWQGEMDITVYKEDSVLKKLHGGQGEKGME